MLSINNENYLRDILKKCGLVSVGLIDKNEAYSFYARHESKLIPIFLPHVVSIRKIRVLTGIIGVAVSNFYEKHPKLSLIISCHSYNFPELASLFEYRENQLTIEWSMKMANVLRELPTDQVKIDKMIEQGAIIRGVSIVSMVHQNTI